MNKELIRDLKRKNYARQAGWLKKYRPDEYEILDAVGHENRLRLDVNQKWVSDTGPIGYTDTLILKYSYEPEPEYEEWEIRTNKEGNLAAFNKASGLERTLGRCAHHPTFVCFHYIAGAETTIYGDVPNWLRANPGQTMYARFVKESSKKS